MSAEDVVKVGRRRIIFQLSDLDTLGPKDRVDLAGDVVFVTMDDVDPGEGYIRQPDRFTALQRPWDKESRAHVWVREEALSDLSDGSRSVANRRILFDRILWWGMLQSGPTIVISGGKVGSQISLEVMIFVNRALHSITEYELSQHSFPTELQDRLDRLEQSYPGYRVVYLDQVLPPLPDEVAESASQDITSTSGPLRVPALRRLATDDEKPSRLVGLGTPLLLGVGVAGYAGLVASGWGIYQSAITEFESEIAPVRAVYNTGENALERMENHERFLNEEQVEPYRVQTIRAIAGYVADKEDMVLSRIEMTTNPDLTGSGRVQRSSSKRNADFQVILGAPSQEGINALDQARPMMNDLSSRVGVSLRMVSFESRKVDTGNQKDAPYRFYTLEGTIPERSVNGHDNDAVLPVNESHTNKPRLLGEP